MIQRYNLNNNYIQKADNNIGNWCKWEDVKPLEQTLEATKRQMEEYAELNNGLRAIIEMNRKKIEILEIIIDDRNKAEAMNG
jgi:hypothetical protein